MSQPPTASPLATPFDAAWQAAAGQGLSDADLLRLRQAAAWSLEAAGARQAGTGEPLAGHGAAVAVLLAELGADADSRISALLSVLPEHAEVEGKPVSPDRLRAQFGPEVVTLVQGTRALLRLGWLAGRAADGEEAGAGDQKEMRRKMLLAMAADLRIVLMRLASRLQSLRWYAESRTPCPEAVASEALNLYAPLANRLGIWQIKWEMEDLAFRFLSPDTYREIARQLEEKRVEREAFIAAVVARLRAALDDAGLPAQVSGRPKHIYSIWNKMRNKHLSFQRLFDLRALRVIVEDERACYGALALVHALWTPVAEEFDDYIARPKPNGYRSLHTVVADADGRSFEVQIRTHEMHQFAEYGMAAHWRYKEAGRRGGLVSAGTPEDQRIAWMRRLLAWEREGETGDRPAPKPADARIYVLTPQARVIELPEGATPVDFAYHLHTDLGHRCRGARVDGQLVPLNTPLQTGQTVEIQAAKAGGPSRDWLNPQLGFLASMRARAKVRAWFNAVELQERISQGQAMVEKELQRLGRTAVNQDQLAQQHGYARADDLYVAAAKEEFSLRQIEAGFKAPAAEPGGVDPFQNQYGKAVPAGSPAGRSGVLVVGVDALLTQLARCCRPAPPDAIAGFVTRGRGVSIHRADCASYAALAARQPERLIEVDWGKTGEALYPVDISVHAPDRPSLLRDVSDVFGRLKTRVVGVNTQSRRALTHLVFTVEVTDGEQIQRVLAALNEVPGVQASRR